MWWRRLAAVVVALGGLSGCAGLIYLDSPEPPPFIPPPVGARVTPVKFAKLTTALRHGSVIGQYRLGLTCLPPFSYITWGTSRWASISSWSVQR